MSIPAGYKGNQWGYFYKESDNSGPYFLGADGAMHQSLTDADLRASPVAISGVLGTGDLTTDAWGAQKMSLPHSVYHGLFTFDVPPSQWFMYHGATQVYTSTNIKSTKGAGEVTATAAVPVVTLESKYTPRYQPNRGHLFSTALWCPDADADGIRDFGLSTVENGVYFRLDPSGLCAVQKSGGVETRISLIDTSVVPGFDISKGNVYDIQYQWRGVGDYFFFINLKLVHVFLNLGTLTALSMEDPALPVHFKSTRTTQDVSMFVGCADITSENGDDDRLQYASVTASRTITGTDTPLFVMYNPLQINGKTNTRMLELARITMTSDKKGIFKVWITRDPAAITGATLATRGGGSYVQTDASPGAVPATSVNTALLNAITSIPAQANTSISTNNPFSTRIDFPIVRGDYLVITLTATTATCESTVEWGEAL
jgi:hypothetical protein